jgi:APA family basic amino acid/polyamine antiporter
MVVANMIGAGVFTTSGYALADLGDRQHVMLAWGIGGLIAICGAVSYGRLAQRISESGGEYLFLSRLLHPTIGFIAGWVSLLAGFTGAIAFAATAFESYAIPESVRPDWLRSGILGIASIVFFGVLHSVVLKTGLWAQNLIVVFKLVLLGSFLTFAYLKFPAGWDGMQVQTDPVDFSIYTFASTLVWISLSFSGFNAAVYVTGEVESPKRNVPRAMLIATVVVTMIYLGLNFVFVYGASPAEIKGVPNVAAVASESIGGDVLAILIRAIVCVALLSSVSSMIVAGPRVYAKMADDGVFPDVFRSKKHDQLPVPVAAIWLQVILASVVVYFSDIRSLLDYLGFTLSLSAALTVACVFWSRRSEDTGSTRFLFTAIAFVYVFATIVLAVLSVIGRPQQLIGLAATIASGLYVNFLLAHWKTSD